uniref:Uncharacterized protein n=1 Tax=Anopheles quadriannulatus TaxID=34691 RepID=A0A182XQP1_ANOQN
MKLKSYPIQKIKQKKNKSKRSAGLVLNREDNGSWQKRKQFKRQKTHSTHYAQIVMI